MNRTYNKPATIALVLLAFLSSAPCHAQFLIDKDDLFSDYPSYNDMAQNSLLESGIDEDLIKRNKVKVLTEWAAFNDTVIKLQTLYYDSTGSLTQRQLFVYGQLDATDFYSYDADKRIDTVYNEMRDYKNRRRLGRVIRYDIKNNPISYINYGDIDYTRNRPDSIIYAYTYDTKGRIKTSNQKIYRDEDPPRELLHEYSYNAAGKEILHTISSRGKQVFSAQKNYGKSGQLIQAIKKDDDNTVTDSIKYHYNAIGKIAVIVKHSKHDPLMTKGYDQIFRYSYNNRLLIILKEALEGADKGRISYTWEFY